MMLRALPGYYAARVIGDLWAGVPIGTMDVVSTVGEAYLPARYAGLVWRGAARVRPEALRLGPRMSLDHLLTQRAALASGQAHAVNPRPQAARPRTFVLVKDGWLAPVPREVMRSLGAREGLFLAKETLQNLAIEGVGSSGFLQRVILHFRCAGLLREDDPQCQS